jgi:adenine specific DNA methylase Mod
MTELIWEGKYKDGQKVAPLRVKLPFQTVETVNESAQERQHTMDLFSNNMPSEWRNRLIWGDKKYVLPALLDEFAGKVNLIYIDPPFDTGADFSFNVQVDGEDFTKAPSIIEQKAYRDTWGVSPEERAAGKTHLDKYLQWFYETTSLLKDLLSDTGSIYVHLDWHVVHYAKIILDEIFGASNLVNEIIWERKQAAAWQSKQFGITNDTILFYSKSNEYVFNPEYSKDDVNTQKYIHERFIFDDGDGRKYMKSPLINPLDRPNLKYVFHGVQPPPKGWLYSQERMEDLFGKNELVLPEGGKGRIYRKIYDDTYKGQVIQNIWTDIPIVNPVANERLGFATQKPEALLRRIINSSSNDGQLVLDCFIGSGTTVAVAEKLNRRWIACDLGRFAINTTRKRLLSIHDIKPFVVQNLGKYERQLWQAAEFGDKAESTQLNYRQFILNLYNAQPVEGYTWLHGLKAGRMVYVGAVDSPVSPSDVGQIAAEFKRATGTGKDAPTRNGIDVLGWDFAFELNEVAKQQAAQANINMRFIRIPREVLEKKAVEQGDIRFFELAALSVEKVQKGQSVNLTITDFVIPQDDVPDDIRKAVTHWEQWIDYWAIDWNNREDTFHNEWQDYRTGKKRELQKTINHTYEKPGNYIIMVKVIDILGNDTTKTLKIEVH